MQTALVSIDAKTNHLTRYQGRKPTHRAYAASLNHELIETFRTTPPDEFFVVASSAVA